MKDQTKQAPEEHQAGAQNTPGPRAFATEISRLGESGTRLAPAGLKGSRLGLPGDTRSGLGGGCSCPPVTATSDTWVTLSK